MLWMFAILPLDGNKACISSQTLFLALFLAVSSYEFQLEMIFFVLVLYLKSENKSQNY